MRRIVLPLASVSLAVLLSCGVAFAAARRSQPKNARTVHTNDTVWTSLRVGDRVYLGGRLNRQAVGRGRLLGAALDATIRAINSHQARDS